MLEKLEANAGKILGQLSRQKKRIVWIWISTVEVVRGEQLLAVF